MHSQHKFYYEVSEVKKLEAELRRYANSDYYPFHMPGHKRRGDEIHRIDITEIDGFDNLHDPQDLIRDEMRFASEHYGTKTTWFSVNGSTCAILTAISAAVPFGGTLLIERGCHISVYHAAYLRHLKLLYLEDEKAADQSFDAVMVTSPSYEGCVKEIEKYVHLAHERRVPLIVDEAHGAHFSMHPYFPESAIKKGADLVIQSVHKTLPAMTQTALLHNVTGRVPDEKIKRFFDIYETSSPSYVLMSSITSCIHQAFDERSDLFERYAARLKKLRHHLAGMRNLHLMGGEAGILSSDQEFAPYPAGTIVDPGKITIQTGGDGWNSGISAAKLYDRLREEYHLQPEMKADSYVLLMTSVYDTVEGFQRLEEALDEIDGKIEKVLITRQPEEGTQSEDKRERRTGTHLPEVRMTIADAMDLSDADKQWIPLDDAAGRVAADYVIIFPPDAPVIVPGEVYDEQVIRTIQEAEICGLTVNGTRENRVLCIG